MVVLFSEVLLHIWIWLFLKDNYFNLLTIIPIYLGYKLYNSYFLITDLTFFYLNINSRFIKLLDLLQPFLVLS